MRINTRYMCVFFFFFKQKTAYEMRISDWSSDVCSSDLTPVELETEVTRPIENAIAALPSIEELVSTISEGRSVTTVEFKLGLISPRSEERRVGKECVSTCRSRWSPYH